MAPGDIFSYNDTVGERDKDNGFQIAHQYQDGKVVDAIGGGVCQPSSTLYNAVLYSGLKIVERHNHSMPVKYVSPGRDATVSYGSLDFRFENNTDGLLFIGATADRETLRFRIFGEKPMTRKVTSISLSDRKYRGNGGFSVSSWRVFKDADGKTTRESLGSSYYRPPAPKDSGASNASESRSGRSHRRRA